MSQDKFAASLAKITGVVLISAMMLFFYNSCKNEPVVQFKKTPADTSKVWLRYFNRTGAVWSDTSTWAIKIRFDTSSVTSIDTLNKTYKEQWKRDSIYYVPYDSLVYAPKDTLRKGPKIHTTIMLVLPPGWNLQEDTKTQVPLTARPGKL